MRVLEIRCDGCRKVTEDCQCVCVVCSMPADGHYQIEDGRWIPVCADGECITLAEGE